MSEQYLYFDIETIPSQSPELLGEIRSGITPPGSIKKAESIEKWMAENADSAAREKLSKTSFDGGYGHVCTISWAIGDGPVKSRHAKARAR